MIRALIQFVADLACVVLFLYTLIMASHRDITASQGWIHELAKGELHPEADRLLGLGKADDPSQLVEESTVDFLMALRESFNDFSRTFNAYSEGGGKFQEIKIYNVAQTAADFMIFRNQMKLVVSNTHPGIIQIAFSEHVRGTLAVDGQLNSQTRSTQAAELTAQVSPFRDVTWMYQGERVQPMQVGRYFFAEFVRATRDHRKSRSGDQMLLEQIKTLLQEKGFDL